MTAGVLVSVGTSAVILIGDEKLQFELMNVLIEVKDSSFDNSYN